MEHWINKTPAATPSKLKNTIIPKPIRGPIKTLAASGVKDFRSMLTEYANRAPLGRTVTTEEVGNVAAFLCSDLASGITGEITYVDAGFNTSAMSTIPKTE